MQKKHDVTSGNDACMIFRWDNYFHIGMRVGRRYLNFPFKYELPAPISYEEADEFIKEALRA